MQCNPCKQTVGLPATSFCKNCGGGIGSMTDALCDPCSNSLNQCKSCRTPMGSGSGSSGTGSGGSGSGGSAQDDDTQ
jgi:hypothetical protein